MMRKRPDMFILVFCGLLIVACKGGLRPGLVHFGSITVGSTPTGATVWLDSIAMPETTNCRLDSVPPGPHTVRLVKSGFADSYRGVSVAAGIVAEVAVTLVSDAGALRVNSEPTGAGVWFDGANTGETTNCTIENVATGSHSVKLTASGYEDWDTLITVVAGDTVQVAAVLAAVTSGWLQVNSTPTGAAVWLDGANTGSVTNCLIAGTVAGQHPLALKLAGHIDYDTTVTISVGDTTTANATLTPVPDTGMVYVGINGRGYEEYLWLKDSMVVIRVPAGVFTTGSTANPDEQPIHDVYLDEFYADKFEVTNRQYKKFCDATARAYPPDPGWSGMNDYFTRFPDYPVDEVSWYDGQAYLVWAGRAYLTEAQWEKAARGTDSRTWPWGDSLPDWTRCNILDNDGYVYTSPVGRFPAGASFYGVMDMAGNLWEWANDWYGSNYYSVTPDSNPPGPATGSTRVARGGACWSTPEFVRCAERYWGGPATFDDMLGFRGGLVRP